MKPVSDESKINFQQKGLVKGGRLLGPEHGCTQGFFMGITYYDTIEFPEPGVHEDQESFYVLEGKGFVKLKEDIYPIETGTAFIALPGVAHSIKRAPDSPAVKVLWCHGAP